MHKIWYQWHPYNEYVVKLRFVTLSTYSCHLNSMQAVLYWQCTSITMQCNQSKHYLYMSPSRTSGDKLWWLSYTSPLSEQLVSQNSLHKWDNALWLVIWVYQPNNIRWAALPFGLHIFWKCPKWNPIQDLNEHWPLQGGLNLDYYCIWYCMILICEGIKKPSAIYCVITCS